ncbi:MAG: enoyl-CoA hydratase/isomerase family protein [Actinomycetota bacterium]
MTLARPATRNAQTPATWRAFAAVGDALAAASTGSDAVRVVVVDAQGPSFSAGLDLRLLDGTGVPGEPDPAALATLGDQDLDTALAGFQAGFRWLRESPLISVASVHGAAVGAGFQLALACDLVVCSGEARFAMRETSQGLVPDLGGTGDLVAAVGYQRALEICATGRWVGSAEAVELGLAVAAVPADELPAAVDDLVAAVLDAPDEAVRETTALLRAAAGRPAAEQLAAERAAQARLLRRLTGRPSGERTG